MFEGIGREMKQRQKNRGRMLRLLLCLFAGLCITVLIDFLCEVRELSDFVEEGEAAVSFNYPMGRYGEGIEVQIKKEHRYPFLTKIYYTLDGSEPTEDDYLYNDPIVLRAEENYSVHSIRAAVFYKGERSRISTATYLVGEQALTRHQIPTLFLTGEEEGFYSNDTGIFVPGKLYENYVANGGEEEATWDVPANFNQTDWMRRVNATLFSANGVCLLNEDCDLSITGNSSRKYVQKPLKLTAETKFTLDFERQQEASSVPHVVRYSKLKFRNGGMDFPEAMLRGALTSALAREAGFEDVAMVQPVAVYINGQYYGVADMQPVYTNSYLADLYGLDKEKIEVFDKSETEILSALGYEGTDFDFNDAAFREAFEQKVDIDQLLRYYAFELIVGNTDWPQNNMKMWRYTGEYVEGNPYTDGRGRFLLYDFDAAFKCRENQIDPFETLFYAYVNGDETGELWDLCADLMRHEEYRSRFVNIIMDDLSGALQTENMLRVLDECEAELSPELFYTIEETPFQEVKENLVDRAAKVERLRNVINEREEQVYSYIYQYFDGETTYELTVQAPTEGNIIEMSSQRVYGGGEPLTTIRCGQYATQVTPLISGGQEFSHWLVNGKKVTDLVLNLTDKDIISENDRRVNVELVTVFSDDESVIINEISEKGDEDYIELYNCGGKSVSLREYYLTDNKKEKLKYQCPDVLLKPGETILLNGRSNPVVNEYIMNFNLKGRERIYLFRQGESESEDSVLIPDIGEGESYGRYLETEEFRFFRNPTPSKRNQ